MRSISIADLGHRCTVSGLAGTGKTYLSLKLFDECKSGIFFNTVGEWQHKYAVINFEKFPDSEIKWQRIFYFIQHNKKVFLNLNRMVPSELVEIIDRISTFLITQNFKDYAFFVDEVGDYVPQGRGTYSTEYERLYRTGRNFGITPIVQITQRLSKPDKNTVGMSQSFVTFMTNFPNDVKRLEEIMGRDAAKWEEIMTKLLSLGVGEFILYKDGEVRL